MFVDTSAFLAMTLKEAEADRITAAIETAGEVFTSGIVRLETAMVLTTRTGAQASDTLFVFDQVLARSGIKSMALTDDISRHAVRAFGQYGKGRGHPAQLNLADCLSYACAKTLDMPILFKGDDFSKTDLKLAKY
jgi:ribonuclease VapC